MAVILRLANLHRENIKVISQLSTYPIQPLLVKAEYLTMNPSRHDDCPWCTNHQNLLSLANYWYNPA